jgi:hypothetical protein
MVTFTSKKETKFQKYLEGVLYEIGWSETIMVHTCNCNELCWQLKIVKNLETFFHVDVKVLLSLGQKQPETKDL